MKLISWVSRKSSSSRRFMVLVFITCQHSSKDDNWKDWIDSLRCCNFVLPRLSGDRNLLLWLCSIEIKNRGERRGYFGEIWQAHTSGASQVRRHFFEAEINVKFGHQMCCGLTTAFQVRCFRWDHGRKQARLTDFRNFATTSWILIESCEKPLTPQTKLNIRSFYIA